MTAPVDYERLDVQDAPVRIRLQSTVVRAQNAGASSPGGYVDVAYVKDGRLQRVRAKGCVLACWNTTIPYLCPELPERQKQALHYLVKVPLVYTSVVNPQKRAYPLWVTVVHFFNRQMHHRGQLTTLLSQAGVDPGVTDLIWLPGVQLPT